VGLTRTYSAVLFAIPFSTDVILRWNPRLIVQALVGLALGGIPFLIGLLLYNHAITGNALLPPQALYDGKSWGLSGASIRIYHNMFELLDWTSAPILTIYFISFVYLAICRHLTFVDFLFPLFLVGMAFYNADAGNDRYGPRYLFEAYPFFALTCGSGLSLVIERRPALAGSAVFLCILGSIGGLIRIPAISTAFSRIIDERM